LLVLVIPNHQGDALFAARGRLACWRCFEPGERFACRPFSHASLRLRLRRERRLAPWRGLRRRRGSQANERALQVWRKQLIGILIILARLSLAFFEFCTPIKKIFECLLPTSLTPLSSDLGVQLV